MPIVTLRRFVLFFALSALLGGLPTAALAEDEGRCERRKLRASGDFSRCLAWDSADEGRDRHERCERKFAKRLRRAERSGECVVEGDEQAIGSFLSDVNTVVADAVTTGGELPVVIEPVCDTSTVNLLDFPVWQKEDGYWVGEYSFYGPDGDPNVSENWPYPYDHYRGFIHLAVEGNAIKQRNVFLYPPRDSSLCTGSVDESGNPTDVVGDGQCGHHGNEKIFAADQKASDCEGSLGGPFVQGSFELSTETTILGDDTVVYQVRLFPGGPLLQNQLTTLPSSTSRIRTAQGIGFGTGAPTYASYYRENKVTEEEFFSLLEETRIEYNIREQDECGYDQGNAPSGVTCAEHFFE
jgi:hypothetical protein